MSSNRTILSRPRTRIYNSNYNIGESYYKGALDRLDRKYSGRPLSPPRQSPIADITDRHARLFADEDLETSRRRAEKHITEAHAFDTRSGRIGSRLDAFDNDIDSETASTLKRIRAQKKSTFADDIDLESASNNISTHRLLDRSEKILDSVGINESRKALLDDDVSIKRRSFKLTSASDTNAEDLTKWSALEDRTSSAALRARQSKARIDDIDEEMAALAEKQAARERRVARLKALVADCESDTIVNGAVDVQSVSMSARKEKKTVRF